MDNPALLILSVATADRVSPPPWRASTMHAIEGTDAMTDFLVTHRRSVIVGALGVTAAGAAMAAPMVGTMSAQERIDYHSRQLELAFRDYYAGLKVTVLGNHHTPEQARRSPGYLVFGADLLRLNIW
jgi:hypothetical protein